jgi:hypothetical protein
LQMRPAAPSAPATHGDARRIWPGSKRHDMRERLAAQKHYISRYFCMLRSAAQFIVRKRQDPAGKAQCASKCRGGEYAGESGAKRRGVVLKAWRVCGGAGRKRERMALREHKLGAGDVRAVLWRGMALCAEKRMLERTLLSEVCPRNRTT